MKNHQDNDLKKNATSCTHQSPYFSSIHRSCIHLLCGIVAYVGVGLTWKPGSIQNMPAQARSHSRAPESLHQSAGTDNSLLDYVALAWPARKTRRLIEHSNPREMSGKSTVNISTEQKANHILSYTTRTQPQKLTK